YIASEIMGSQLSFVTLGCVRGMPLHTDRRNDIGQTGQGQLFLVLASGCSIRASQRGKSIHLARGDLTLMSGNEPARLTQSMERSNSASAGCRHVQERRGQDYASDCEKRAGQSPSAPN